MPAMPRFVRLHVGVLTSLEQPTLLWLAARLPAELKPDHLTAIGFAGAVIVFAGYACSPLSPHWLWLANIGLAINWFGDSLDGTVARYRNNERPRYGYFLDNTVDVTQQFLLAFGIALSGIIRPDLCFLALSLFLAMSVLTLLRAQTTGKFHLTYSGLGPTELRVIFILLNVAVVFFPPRPFIVADVPLTYPDALSALWSFSIIVTFIANMAKDLMLLSVEDPPPRP